MSDFNPQPNGAAPKNTGGQRGEYRKPPVEFQFQKGNPGRPRGSRNKIGEEFLAALQADFLVHGDDVVEKVRKLSPTKYLQIVAKLLPQQLEIDNKTEIQVLTDEQLKFKIDGLQKKLWPKKEVPA